MNSDVSYLHARGTNLTSDATSNPSTPFSHLKILDARFVAERGIFYGIGASLGAVDIFDGIMQWPLQGVETLVESNLRT